MKKTKAVKTPTDSATYIAEIVGEESLFGQRMSAGKLLHMMDVAAGHSAAKHAECPLVTLAFDRVELLNFIYHMDYVHYDAYVIKVGRSSIVVNVEGYTKQPTQMEIQPAHSGVITMVAIDKNKRPCRNIPALEYRTSEDLEKKKMAQERERILKQRRQEIAQIDSLKQIRSSRLKDFYKRKYYYTPAESELKIRKVFLPRNANSLGIIFGGDTIEMMEELALASARQFTGNFGMVTIAMEDVLFMKPLNVDNLVEMDAKVIFVANTTLAVEITVRAIDYIAPYKSHVTNKGVFTVLNYDRAGKKTAIASGLDMSRASLAEKRSYLKEQIKYENRFLKRSSR